MSTSTPSKKTKRSGAGDRERELGAGKLADEPGYVWLGRQNLPKETIDLMDSLPILCIENGKIKVFEQAVEEFKKDDKALKIVNKFIETMKEKNFEVATGEGEKATKNENRVVSPLRLKEPRKLDFEPNRALELGKKRKQADHHTNRQALQENSDFTKAAPELKVARQLEMFRVPAAFSAGDKMTLFDYDNMKKLNQCIEIPTNCYDGIKLDIEALPKNIKVLCCDHKGFKCGNTITYQHANRLHIHRQLCRDPKCPVLGCGNDAVWNLFKNLVDVNLARKYKMHWSARKRENQRKHGQQLRLDASF